MSRAVAGSRYLWPAAVDYRAIGGLADRLRDATPPEWIRHARAAEDAAGLGPDEGGSFVEYFIGGEDGPVEAVPPEVAAEMHEEMMEAKRQAGWAVLSDFCVRLRPVVAAIEDFAGKAPASRPSGEESVMG